MLKNFNTIFRNREEKNLEVPKCHLKIRDNNTVVFFVKLPISLASAESPHQEATCRWRACCA